MWTNLCRAYLKNILKFGFWIWLHLKCGFQDPQFHTSLPVKFNKSLYFHIHNFRVLLNNIDTRYKCYNASFHFFCTQVSDVASQSPDVSDIKRTSQSSLRQRLSSSRLLDGPVNSSMSYPTSSTPNANRILDIPREGLSSCVKQLMFDSETSYQPSLPSGVSSSSVSWVEPSCEQTATFCSQEIPSSLDLQAPSSASLQPLYSSSLHQSPSTGESTLSLHQPSSASLQPLYSYSRLEASFGSQDSTLSLHQPSSASMLPLYSASILQDSSSSQESTLSLQQPSSASLQPLYSSSLQMSTCNQQSSVDLRPPSSASLQALYSSSLQGSACSQQSSYSSIPRPACEGCESTTGGPGYAGDLDDTRPDDLDDTHYETAPSHLSSTVDSDASAFLDGPLCTGPVTGKHRPVKFRRVSRQLQRLSRQIHRKGSKALNLKTLAVLWTP